MRKSSHGIRVSGGLLAGRAAFFAARFSSAASSIRNNGMAARTLSVIFLLTLMVSSVFAQNVSAANPQPNASEQLAQELNAQIQLSEVAHRLAGGTIDPAAYAKLLMLSEEDRQELRALLLKEMTEADITARTDLYAIVGPAKDQLISADDIHSSVQKLLIAPNNSDPIFLYVPFYSQNSWYGGQPLGYNWCGNSTIGNLGCHLTCIAMLYGRWGYWWLDPFTLNNWAMNGESHYAFSPSGCGDLIRLPQALWYGYICRGWHYVGWDQIYSELQAGHPVIAHTNQYYGSHFVVIWGWTGSQFLVKDPAKDDSSQNQILSGYVFNFRVYGY